MDWVAHGEELPTRHYRPSLLTDFLAPFPFVASPFKAPSLMKPLPFIASVCLLRRKGGPRSWYP